MNSIHEPDVLAALDRGHKLEAIQALCACRGIGLEDADALIDRYLAYHPELAAKLNNPLQNLVAIAVLAAMVLGVCYFGYFF